MTYRLSFAALGLAAWLTSYAPAADVEVLARGPVHEAYAEPSEREPAPTPVIPKEPPKLIEELPPDQKPEGDNVQWLPGYWAWDEEKKDHIWISGFWRNTPPGRTWVPGSWRKATDGWQWTGGFWAGAKDDKANLDYLPKPPAPLDNAGPATPAPSENHTYVPGSWVYRDDRYVWRPGFWSEHRQGWVWVSAHYRWTPAGYVFIDGYWDYPLKERGILFAPAYIPPTVYSAPAYVYTPTVVVREECLFGAFFARRGYGCYYFGDYFGASYASVGFVSWCGYTSATVRIGGWCDPLFSYYSCGFRADAFWGGGIVNLYCGRYRGDYLCPPRTLVQQNTVINNITNNNTVNNVNLNNVTMLTSLNEAGRGGRRNLQTLSDPDRRAQQQAARSVREVADRRATLENDLAGKPSVAGQSASPKSLTLDVPKRPTPTKTAATPKGIDAGTGAPISKSPPAAGPTSPPALPKPTAVGKGATNPVLPKNPPLISKSPASPPDVTSKSPAPKVDAPASKSPVLPPAAKPVAPPVVTPKSPVLPPAPNSVAPPATVPKAPTLPPASRPAAPPVTVPKAGPNLPAVPRSAPPAVTPRSAPPAVAPRPVAPAPKPVVPSRPAPRPAAVMPAPSVSRGVAPSIAPRSVAPSRPAPSISRPPASRPPVQAPARPAAPKKGKR